VLLAYAKKSLAGAVLASTLPDSRYLEQDLRGYFPPLVVERFNHLLPEHPLRRELIATIVANDVVNSQGITFVTRLSNETGAEGADVVRAYRVARDVTGAVERWEAIEALVGRVEPSVLGDLLGGVDRLVERTSRWYLANMPDRLGRAIEAHREPFRQLSEALPDVVTEASRHERERYAWRLVDQGVPEETARRHAFQAGLVHGPNIIVVAERTGRPVPQVARAFFAVGESLFIDWLEGRLAELPTPNKWHRWAVQAVQDDLLLVRRLVAEKVLEEAGDRPADEGVAAFLDSRSDAFDRLSRFMRGMALEDANDLAAMTVALRQVRALAS
jgi:glutamate dehydrogenase